MISKNILMIALLTVIMVPHASTMIVNFQKTLTTSNLYSSFALGYVSASTNLTAIVTPVDLTASYSVVFWRPGAASPQDTPFKSAGTFTGQKAVSAYTDSTGNWRVQVLPNGIDFVFGIQFYASNQSVGKFYGVASFSRVFCVYYATQGFYTASLTLYSGSLSDMTFSVYSSFQSLAVSGGSQIKSTAYSSSTATLNFYSRGKQYFYIILRPNSKLLALAPYISFTYSSDVYQCPFGKGVTDINGNFQGCSINAPTQGYPCLANNKINNYCTYCADPYAANEFGTCVLNMNCGPFQYWHFGSCHDVITNCKNFDKIGGLCSECVKGYKIVNYNDGSQSCEKQVQVCKSNQYLLGYKCYDNVENCINFVIMNGTCLNCAYGYDLVNNTCIIKPVPTILCPVGQNFVKGMCQNSDPYCVFYGDSNKCQLCATGWKYSDLTGVCTKIICGSRQCSYKGFCLDVSPTCDTFDPIYGTCKSCIVNYYLRLDGSCVQSYLGGATQTDCQSGYYFSGTTCVQVSNLCDGYLPSTGKCIACKDKVNYYLINGVCQNVNTYCNNNYRTYFSNGVCVPISQLCDDYDRKTGSCLTCKNQTFLDSVSGRCKYNVTCGPKQYYGVDGNCLDANQNCSSIDRNTGACLSCEVGFDLNKNTCCRHSFYMDTKQCAVFLAQNCAKYNPVNGCLECKPGYYKPDGLFFTKCIS